MKKILVAEDDPASREFLVEALGGLGYEVIEAQDGEEALRKALLSLPDLILLDIQMPLLDGYGVLRRLREDARFAATPILTLTAYAMPEEREKTLRAGFNAHLSKPLNVSLLRGEIARYLAPQPPS